MWKREKQKEAAGHPDHDGRKEKKNQEKTAKVGKGSKKESRRKNRKEKKVFAAKGENRNGELFGESRKTIKERISPNGVNPNPLDYMIIDDAGEQVYIISMYIEKMPLTATFANTFSTLFNFQDVLSNVHINPLVMGTSSSLLDKRILKLDSERVASEKDGDRNRLRKVSGKLAEAESWARDIEQGENCLYEVIFLFTLMDKNFEQLRLKVSDFHARAAEKSIELSACYGCHPEALLSAMPVNRMFEPARGMVRTSCAKKHIMDKFSLSCIFNHTTADFSHKDGIVIGRKMNTGQPVTFDIYDPSLNGYNLMCCGKTGTGKSATIKMWLSRYADFGYQIASVDCEPRGNKGEYALMAERLGGVSYQIKANSKVILNLFEVNEEDEYDEATATEYKVLRLTDKRTDIRNIIMNMIMADKPAPLFEDATACEKIINDAVAALYDKRGIYDQQVDSLYGMGGIIKGGKISSGKVKKELPTLHEFYMEILHQQKDTENEYHKKAYALITDSLSDYVRELYYCPHCLREYTRQEYEELKTRQEKEPDVRSGAGGAKCRHEDGKYAKIRVVKGTRPYYDGQTSIHADINTIHVNIDISQLPDVDKPIAQEIGMNYLNENYVKRNSMNPKKVRKMVFLIDELHKLFPYKEARLLVSQYFRTARKRHVSVWAATQALADCKGYEETEAIVKNTSALLLLKQDFQDKSFLLENTILTPAQVEQLLALGGNSEDLTGEENEKKDRHKGEICLICNDRVTFIKVDYLKASESYIVETEASKISAMHEEGGDSYEVAG